ALERGHRVVQSALAAAREVVRGGLVERAAQRALRRLDDAVERAARLELVGEVVPPLGRELLAERIGRDLRGRGPRRSARELRVELLLPLLGEARDLLERACGR